MKVALWLAWRELTNRRWSFVIGITMIAIAVALCAATEFVSRAREAAVMAKIDYIGPAFRLIPAGFTASDLVRFEIGAKMFPKEVVDRLHRQLSPWSRAIEKRLLLKETIEGITVPVIGIEPNEVISPFDDLSRLGENNVALGTSLAHKLGKVVGNPIQLKGREFKIIAILPTTGSGEDIALFLSLGSLQRLSGLSDAINEIRLFPRSGRVLTKIKAVLESNYPEIKVINIDHGQVAERQTGESLKQYRWVLYISAILVMAFCVLIWSYLNAEERWLELATLVSIGGTGMTVFVMLIGRAAIVGFAGSICGYAAGALFTLAQDFSNAWHVVWSWNLLFVVIAGTIGLSIVAAVPVSILSSYREHVAELQM